MCKSALDLHHIFFIINLIHKTNVFKQTPIHAQEFYKRKNAFALMLAFEIRIIQVLHDKKKKVLGIVSKLTINDPTLSLKLGSQCFRKRNDLGKKVLH